MDTALSTANALGTILLVDDEEHIVDLLKLNLEAERFHVKAVANAAQVASLDLTSYRVIIVDAMQQGYNGLDLLRDLKANPVTQHIPVIIISHNDSEDSIIGAFDAGADDYILKPFSLRELVARLRSVIRRHPLTGRITGSKPATVLKFRGLEMDLVTRQVREDGMLLPLTKTEYAILSLLLKNKNHFYNRAQIFDEVWRDADTTANDRIVDTNISRLRKKLGDSAAGLVNRTGQGYALID